MSIADYRQIEVLRISLTSGLRTPNDLGPAWPTIVHTAAQAGPGACREGASHFPPRLFLRLH